MSGFYEDAPKNSSMARQAMDAVNPSILVAMAQVEAFLLDYEDHPQVGLPVLLHWLRVRSTIMDLMSGYAARATECAGMDPLA